MSFIVETPKPPYYAVIAPVEFKCEQESEEFENYFELAVNLFKDAENIPGYLGMECCFQGRFEIAVSYWESLEAIQAWRENAKHLSAKQKGREVWFKHYFTRIAKVERDY